MSDRHTEIFEEHRETLVTLAYEMLGRVMEAEDAVQEAYLRWREVDLEGVEAPGELPVDDGYPPVPEPPELGAGAPRVVSGTLAPRADPC